MANYNHEILVNYLRDVYSMELLVHKIQADICSARKDIQREQAVVAKAESTPVPVEGIVSCPQEDVFLLIRWGCIIFPVSLFLFKVPLIGWGIGVLGIIFSLICFLGAIAGASVNSQRKEAEKKRMKEVYQREKKKYENLLACANDYRSFLPAQINDYNAAIPHLQEAKKNLQQVYAVNIIPNKYRSVYVAYYLYDYISSSRETDIDRVLQTMLLDQIIAKLDKIIAQQEEIILNQRMQLAKQDALLAQSKKQHEEQMKAISNLEENQQMQNDYLAMTEANTRITNYFVTADYINKYI